MNKKELKEYLKEEALKVIRTQAPVRTGNLRDSIKVRDTSNGFEVYIDESQAEYAPYTTEPWISPKWKGKKNPNQYWDKQASLTFIRRIKNKLK